MKSGFASLAIVFILCAMTALAQSPDLAARSHVERFSTPETRAEKAEAEATAKLQTNPQDAQAYNLRALARMRLNRYSDAYADLRQAVALQPANAGYQANLGYVLWKLGHAPEALSAERAALKLDDKNYTAHYQLGRFLFRLGDPKLLPEAAAHLRRALELDNRQYEVRFELIAVYRALSDTAQALAQLSLLQDARPSDPRVLYVNGLLAADRNDINGAIGKFREALQRDATLTGAWQDLGLAYIKLNRWPDAVATFAELVKRQSDSVEAAYFYALALYNSGNPAEAEKEARRALRLNAGASDAYTLLGIILAARESINEASDALTQAVALNPANFDAQFNLGRVQYALKDYEGAVKSFRAAVQLNPQHAQSRFFLGTTLEDAGDTNAALGAYQELVKLDDQSAYGQLGLGALLLRQGKKDEAIGALQRAVALDPKNFEAHWALGRALNLAERYNEAVLTLQTAVALNPNRPDAHFQLGQALRRLGRNEEAAREFALVERLNKEFRTGAGPKN